MIRPSSRSGGWARPAAMPSAVRAGTCRASPNRKPPTGRPCRRIRDAETAREAACGGRDRAAVASLRIRSYGARGHRRPAAPGEGRRGSPSWSSGPRPGSRPRAARTGRPPDRADRRRGCRARGDAERGAHARATSDQAQRRPVLSACGRDPWAGAGRVCAATDGGPDPCAVAGSAPGRPGRARSGGR